MSEQFVVKAQRTKSQAKGKTKSAEIIRYKSISSLPNSFETFRSNTNVDSHIPPTPKKSSIPTAESERNPFKFQNEMRSNYNYRSAKKLQRHRSSPRDPKPVSEPTPRKSSSVISEIPDSVVWKKNPEAEAIRDMLIRQLAMQESEENRKIIEVQKKEEPEIIEEETKPPIEIQNKRIPNQKKSLLKLAMRRQKAATLGYPEFSITRDDEQPFHMLTELKKEFGAFSKEPDEEGDEGLYLLL